MTDEEIIKALECCAKWESDKSCENCPANTYGFGCANKRAKYSLDLINRKDQKIAELEAEVERLQRHNKEYGFCNLLGNCLVYSKNLKDYNDMRKGLKSEAYREFEERLVDIAVGNWCHKVDVATITNTLKELTEINE